LDSSDGFHHWKFAFPVMVSNIRIWWKPSLAFCFWGRPPKVVEHADGLCLMAAFDERCGLRINRKTLDKDGMRDVIDLVAHGLDALGKSPKPIKGRMLVCQIPDICRDVVETHDGAIKPILGAHGASPLFGQNMNGVTGGS
jgi:hypothetical protein